MLERAVLLADRIRIAGLQAGAILAGMGSRNVQNAIIIGAVLLVLYLFVGQDFVRFYLGGKAELLETAAEITQQCAVNRACPTKLAGWQPWGDGRALYQGNMLYFVAENEGAKPQSFRLVYRFFMPDDWYEAEGGVGKPVISGWKKRQEN